MWYKMPELDEKGRLGHTVALEYQRFLAMTESAEVADPTPQPLFTDASPHPLFKNRLDLVPGVIVEEKVGRPKLTGKQLHIPLHPMIGMMQQVWIPSSAASANVLLGS